MAYEDLAARAASIKKQTFDRVPGTFKSSHEAVQDQIYNKLFKGVIVDSTQYAHSYLVSIDRGGTITAVLSTTTGLDHFSYRSHTMLTPGTRVLCYRDIDMYKCFIIGILHHEMVDNNEYFSDAIHQASRCGFLDEQHHSFPINTPFASGIRNHSTGRPIDVVPGEYGGLNELGMGMNVSLNGMSFKISEIAGLSLYYLDHLVRMAAYNYQIWTGAKEEESYCDEGENTDVIRISSFPWEMLGAVEHEDSTISTTNDKQYTSGIDTCYYEPAQDDQLGIFRYQHYRGYLGDASRTFITCPPSDISIPETLDNTTKHIGLSEIAQLADGVVGIRSAKSIHLEKVCYLPNPKQTALHDDPAGDSQSNKNYKFAGEGPNGKPHNKYEFSWGDGNTPSPNFRNAQLYDMHAWLFNTYANVSIGRHENDWHIWEESTPPTDLPSGQIDPAIFNSGSKYFETALPDYSSIKIDNRPGHIHKIYKSRSLISMLDDGSVILEDGYGSQIIMSGGNITITCQGDIWERPGRNVNVWAPHDIILKSGNCTDISASQGDVRIKAEYNLHCIAGNSEDTGGIMLESRANGFTNDYVDKYGTDVISTGIALVSKNSQILGYANRIYLRSLDSGDIFLDADKGNGNIYTFSDVSYHTYDSQRMDIFGITPGDDASDGIADVYTKDSVILGQTGALIVNTGEMWAPDCDAVFGGSVFAQDLTQNNNSPTVGDIWGSQLEQELSTVSENTDKQNTDSVNPINALTPELYDNNTLAGNDDLINSLGFSFRTDDQYDIQQLKIIECRWQQFFSINNSTLVWDENIVNTPDGTKTMAYPGYNTWNSDIYITNNFTYWNEKFYNDRNLDDTNPMGEPPQSNSLATSYLINLQ